MQFIPSLLSITPHYSALLVDLWGVIHDGQQLYPNVRETLEQLKQRGTQVIFLSNAPRRAYQAMGRLAELGIERTLYQEMVTSGEVSFHALQERQHPALTSDMRRFCFIGAARDRHVIEDLSGWEETSVEAADCLINSGFDDDDPTDDVPRYLPLVEAAIARKIPMFCLNPDRIIIKQNGETCPCAGLLADVYEERGGVVYYYGKPYPDVYETAFALLPELPRQRFLMVGDNLETDIPGAAGAGIDSVLITGGVLSIQLQLAPGQLPETEALDGILSHHSHRPTYVAAGFY